MIEMNKNLRAVRRRTALLLAAAALAFFAGCRRQIIVQKAAAVEETSRDELPPAKEIDSEEKETGSSTQVSVPVTETEDRIYVHVAGQVAAPGVYELREGERTFRAIEAAGGFTAEADRDWCNLAYELQDADQLEIYSTSQTAAMREAGVSPQADRFGIRRAGDVPALTTSGGSADADGKTVNLNTADKEQLMLLPGIGAKRAEDIIAYRTGNGGFASVEDLTQISGIGESLLSKLRGMVTVG